MPAVMLTSTLLGFLVKSRRIRFYSRAIASYMSLLLCASYGICASIVLRIIGRQSLAQWTTARSFALITTPLVNWQWDIEGVEILSKNRPAVFIANHQSEMDVLVLGKVFGAISQTNVVIPQTLFNHSKEGIEICTLPRMV
jgi:lysophosphatidate acyltransferase